MKFRYGWTLLLCAAVLPCASAPLSARTKISDDQLRKRIEATYAREPMLFFIAKGRPGACGPGCDEWIAAEGAIDPEAAKRLSALLATIPGRKPPVYFNSPGGHSGQGATIGNILRANRMATAVGHTIPEGCRSGTKLDEKCRKLLRENGPHKARLVTDEALCASACVSAYMGGSQRTVGRGASLGIHSPLTPSSESAAKYRENLRWYAIQMGVDIGLVEAAAKVPFRDRHAVSRTELERFGLETRGTFATSWAPFSMNSQMFITKAVTRPDEGNGRNYRTRALIITCASAWSGISLTYRREFNADETAASGTGTAEIVNFASLNQLVRVHRIFIQQIAFDVWSFNITFENFERLVSAGNLRIVEKSGSADNNNVRREIEFTTGNLAELMPALKSKCAPGPSANITLPPTLMPRAAPSQQITGLPTRGFPTSSPPASNTPSNEPLKPTLEWKSGQFVVGKQIGNLRPATRAECETQCLADKTCRAVEFTEHNHGCGLYSSVTFAGAGGLAEVGTR